MQKNKIAIISYHYSPNYGTMLQAYALSAALQKIGCSSIYISYYYKMPYGRKLLSIIKHFLIRHISIIKKKLGGEFYFFNEPAFIKIINKFDLWHEQYIPYTSRKYNQFTIKELNNIYKLFITGSDQTWSPYMNTSPFSLYFTTLEFVNDHNSKNSYAPSFGTKDIPKDYLKELSIRLESFDNISCREDYGAALLSEKIGKKVECVLDPTLLLTKEEWDLVSKPIDMPKKYILCYILGEKACISEFAEKLGKENSIPVYYILTRPYYLTKKNVLDNVGPGEFISLIRDASFVCTDSFHGTLFSLNYHIPFYSFTKRESNDSTNDNDRIANILSSFGMLSRFRQDDDITFNDDCLFDNADTILSKKREESLCYLQQIVKEI